MNLLVKIFLSFGVVGVSLASQVATGIAPVERSIETEYLQQQSELNDKIEWLSWCESRNNALAVNPNDPDTASYGRFQFKWATWNYYLDRYALFPDTEPLERWNILWDGNAQEQVVRLILQEPEGWRNWYNCLKKYYQ